MMSESEANISNVRLQEAYSKEKPEALLRAVSEEFPGRMAFASSLGLEDQALTDMIIRHNLPIPIFTLDTGRLFHESHTLIERTEKHYGMHITVHAPDKALVQEMIDRRGADFFRQSVELRKECCRVRKIEPLRRALMGLSAWICGLRREQASSRKDLQAVEWDKANGLIKVNPLVDWNEEDVRDYIRHNKVPYNDLHDKGFPSIGCACCTRAVKPGEDIRAGRWWWENPEHKECGLHSRTAKTYKGA